MKLTDYASYDGLGLADLVRRKEVSVDEVTKAALAAIERVNPSVRAVIEVYDDCLDPKRETYHGPFFGVPFLIKDVSLHFKGRKMESGSRLCQGFVVQEDSYFGRLVKETGVTFVGRSSTPEFSMALCAETLLNGNTTTPWKAGYSTSGSSGGAAAAVASGMVPLAHGSDMGGSIRGPAAWCGTIGLYPSRARVSSGPLADEGGNGMTQSFMMTKSMRDTAAMLDCLGKPQPGDPVVIWRPELPFISYTERPPKALRIAYWAKPLMDAPVDPEIAATVERVALQLAALGHHVEEAAPPMDLAVIDEGCKNLWYFGFDKWLDEMGARVGRKVGPDTVERATLAFYHFAKKQSAEAYFNAWEDFNRQRRQIGPFFQTYDIWLTPTCAQVSKPFGTFGMNIDRPPEEFLVHEQRPCQFMIMNNVTGQPGLSLPLGQHSNGLPIGLQLTARHGEEHLLMGVGTQLEEAMPWKDRLPPLHVSKLG